MRTFKFRVWSNVKQGFLSSVVGKEGLLFEIFTENRIYRLSLDDLLPESPYSVVVQQYTGLKDKHGKEIYEGDLVKGLFKDTDYMSWEMITSEVVWVDRVAGFNLSSDLWDKTDIEVVGNIFENTELLK